jgi:carboxymethylenebutenolidase
MCFDHDSRPPIPPIAGGALDARDVTLESADGTRFMGYLARAAEPTGAGMVILPDVRGLHAYYRDLTLRFAEHGVDALAIDYFGRTAGIGDRGPGFEYREHVNATRYPDLRSDITAAASRLREVAGPRSLFTVGFCFGGRLSFLAAGLELDLAGVIGFYGWPVGESYNQSPAPADVADTFQCPVLGLFGGADEGIGADAIGTFESALTTAGVEHQVTTFPGAPHSFFDRKADEFTRTSEEAWEQVQAFIRANTAA